MKINACALLAATAAPLLMQGAKPNVVLILADDMGYGDVSAFNPDSKIHTDAIDALCRSGVMFTDAHSCSGVSTPSRYGIITGRYPFRTTLKDGITDGFSPPMIEASRSTVASMLSAQGYNTACVGKWHLGWQWARTDGKVDYSQPIADGPTTRGFDYFYGLPASLDMVPYVYVENDRVTAVPDRINPGGKGVELMRAGVMGSNFVPEECLQTLTSKALDYIGRQNSDKPFFLYLPLTAPHTPIFPSEKFRGKSGLSVYGDFVLMVDDVVRQVTQKLKEQGLAENTIVIFTSDNGCAPYAGMADMERKGHYPSYIFRGTKSDLFDGGNRIPLIISWAAGRQGQIENGTVSLVDFYATFADIASHKMLAEEGVDSFSLLPLLTGKGQYKRKEVVSQSIDGSFTLRSGRWKMLFAAGSGGWSFPSLPADKDAMASMPQVQLYDMNNDISEKTNVVGQYPRIAQRMTRSMREYILNGRSTPGQPQQNQTNGAWPQTKILGLPK